MTSAEGNGLFTFQRIPYPCAIENVPSETKLRLICGTVFVWRKFPRMTLCAESAEKFFSNAGLSVSFRGKLITEVPPAKASAAANRTRSPEIPLRIPGRLALTVFADAVEEALRRYEARFQSLHVHRHLHTFRLVHHRARFRIAEHIADLEAVLVFRKSRRDAATLTETERTDVLQMKIDDRPGVTAFFHRQVIVMQFGKQGAAGDFHEFDIVSVPHDLHGIHIVEFNGKFDVYTDRFFGHIRVPRIFRACAQGPCAVPCPSDGLRRAADRTNRSAQKSCARP